ncbi:MAG TPA: histidine kinase N-terminal 7TM domain-containing protein [Anaerolineales bacterium]|nr:histidine kinase N-terminal 7TM domain-containing protein [Anaerolineales bacterium]
MDPEITILILELALAFAIALIAYRRSKVPGAISLMIFSAFLALWSCSFLVFALFSSFLLDRICTAVIYLSSAVVASAQFIFSLSYTNRSNWISRPLIGLLSIMPLLTQVLFWGEPWHSIFFVNSYQFGYDLTLTGPWDRIWSIYIYMLVCAGTLLLIDDFIRRPRPLARYWVIILGCFAPFLVLLTRVMDLKTPFALDSSLAAFTIAGLGLSYGILNHDLIASVPLTPEVVIKHMDDGWIVLDMQNVIVDINPAAERIIGLSREKAYGQPISSVLNDLPNLGKTFAGVQELEMKRSIRSQEMWRYLNIRISSLNDQHNLPFGRLIVWRDITEQRLAEDARQRARTEMFVLLNAISSAASHAINLDEFLSETIYQIIIPFRSQVVGIFLMDERQKRNGERGLFLASHFGISEEGIQDLSHIDISSPLAELALKDRQAVLVEDIQNDARIPASLRSPDLDCLLFSQLAAQLNEETRTVGFMFLGRREKPAFSQDEIVRLTTLSDQIAILVDSDRRRKLAIAFSERQRILRDLHDSVSQKLYGLVTLTEAAQAALEAGSEINPSQILSRIGDNARQAVKEMRLFLYQMQPIDVEKEGLISVLHHRLAAVEGRADIKARLLTDESISLSKDKEVALYFIAQEALNNVLRHAHASSVLVTVKQGKRNVILRIQDDGVGFETKKVDRGGMGLRNMHERALQINGKLQVASKPGQGTKIIITVGRDQPVKQLERRR